MHYVIAACPLTKIFCTLKNLENEATGEFESWQDRCINDFHLVEDVEKEFEIEIPGAAAIKFEYMQPQLLKSAPDSTEEARFQVLAGGKSGLESPEYDIYGVVEYDISHDIVQKMHEIAMLSASGSDKTAVKAKIEKIMKDVDKTTKLARDKAIKLSYAKVTRAIKRNHRYLDNQWQKNKERGGGQYMPSVTERLGAISIRDLITKQASQTRNAMTEFAKVMEQTSGR